MAKKNQIVEDRYLCTGVKLGEEFFQQKENRIFTLLLKGLIVYLIAMGSIGFYMSAIDAQYNEFLCHTFVFIVAMLCAFLYYRLLVENLGYLLLFVSFGMLVYSFRDYINSGFYAIVNMTVDNASQYFNVDIQTLYTERIEDRYITITFVCLFIGIVLDVLLNVYISRRMQYMNSIFTVMGLNLIPLYMILEPDALYVIMLLGGFAMAYVLKSSKHYSPQMNVKRNDIKYAIKGKGKQKSKTISYIYNIKALAQASGTAMILVVAVVLIVSAFKPKENFNVGYEGNKYKDLTMAGMTTLLIDGWRGFFEQEYNVGGMQGGRLGDVSSVRLDHETDIILQVTPYSFDTIYLKSFTGLSYTPYENEWVEMSLLTEEEEYLQTPEADVLKEAYDNNWENSAKGTMMIKDIDSGNAGFFMTYYSFRKDELPEQSDSYFLDYYPLLPGSVATVSAGDYWEGEPFSEQDLYVPQENKKAINDVIKDIEWTGPKENYPDILRDYFQENIPYTIRPGRTPRDEDFVNYFLTDNKKGYCTHFATAAVLIFRQMGIPARYVEGYAVNYTQLTDGEIVLGSEFDDYYDGYSLLGETALVQVNVTDADAHAWCEIYITGKGWIPVDVTPMGEEEEVEDFWEMFDETIGDIDGDDQGGGLSGNIVNFKIPNKLIKGLCYGVVALVALFLLYLCVRYGVRTFIYFTKYKNATVSDKLIIRYSLFYKKLCKKDKDMATKLNYAEQIEYLSTRFDMSNEDKEKIIAILEKAGFSNTAIQNSDYDFVVDWLASHRKYAR